MDVAALIKAIDAIVGLATVVGNAAGAADKVGGIIAQRIKDGRTNWSDDELAAVQADLDAARTRADQATAGG